MDIKTEHGLNGNYLIIKDDNKSMSGDELCMLINNDIPGFLHARLRAIDDTDCIYYDISSMISLKHISKRQEFKYKEIREIIGSLITLKTSVEEYLLSDSGMILEPDYVYYDMQSHCIKYCFYPFYEKPFPESLNSLSEFLLKTTDHSDKRAVKVIYEFYSQIQNGDYEFGKLLERPVSQVDIQPQSNSNAEQTFANEALTRAESNFPEKRRAGLSPAMVIFACFMFTAAVLYGIFFFLIYN